MKIPTMPFVFVVGAIVTIWNPVVGAAIVAFTLGRLR